MRFSLFRLALYTLGLTCFGLSQNAHAFKRVYQPMGDYIRASPLIIIADIETKGAPKYQQILTVREVVRGDAKQGDTIEIPIGAVSRWIVPREGKNVAVLLDANWRTKPSVNEVYQQPQEIAALRDFVKIYASPDERAQILALQAKASDENPQYAMQLLAEFARMRDSKNFDIVLSSYKLLESKHKGSLLDLLGRMNDERALPLLIEALESDDSSPRAYAASRLTYNFPGASGVTEAFRKLAKKPETRDLALPYLRTHDPAFAANIKQVVPSLWQAAGLKLKNGETAIAKEQYFALMEKEGVNTWNLFETATLLMPLLDNSEKARLRRLLHSFLLKNENYLYAENAIALLRQLPPDASSTEPLIHVMYSPTDSPYTPWDKASREATFALLNMGQETRKKAVANVLERTKTRLKPDVSLNSNEETLYFCQLAWLADDETWQTVLGELSAPLAAKMKALQPLRDAATSKQEAAALSALLPDRTDLWQGNSNLWIIARLGELRAQTAVTPLYEELERTRFSGNSNQIEAALIEIGGEAVENGAMQLLRSPHNELRDSGIDILRALKGEKMRPLLRRMLIETDFGDRQYAIFQLGYIGQPEDLPLLLPFTNFWENDRAIQSKAVEAVVGIRYRCGYDVNGPIKK